MAPDPSESARALRADIAAHAGARTSELRVLRRQWTRDLRDANAAFVLSLARRALSGADDTVRWVVYELITSHPPALSTLRARHLEWLGRGIASWGAVDTFACYLAGPAWREGQVPTALIQRWARSKDRWWRRAALASTVALNVPARGGSGDAGKTIRICQMLVDDRDDMVVKALSWALRALARQDPESVRRFVDRYDDRLAARVRREVTHKLTTGLKSPRRRRPASRSTVPTAGHRTGRRSSGAGRSPARNRDTGDRLP